MKPIVYEMGFTTAPSILHQSKLSVTAPREAGLFVSSQAPAWEFSTGSSSFQSREAGASLSELPSEAWEPAQKKCTQLTLHGLSAIFYNGIYSWQQSTYRFRFYNPNDAHHQCVATNSLLIHILRLPACLILDKDRE